jgi:hypothetical protein
MQVVLVMFKGDQRRSFSVTRDTTIIGRREDCDLRIPLGDVSRKHCRLIKDGDALRIEDLGSSNGTYINGERVQQASLSAGDTLQVGPVVFVAQVNGLPEDDDLQPVVAAAVVPAGDSAEADAAGLEPTAQSEAADGEFDPMEALNADGSVADFNIEDALNEVGGPDAGSAAVGMDDSEVDALDEVPMDAAPLEEVPLDEAPLDEVPLEEPPADADLEDAEHDHKA